VTDIQYSMSVSKEVIAGVAAASLVGGVLGYFISKKVHCNSVTSGEEYFNNVIHKSTSKLTNKLDKYVIDNSLREPEVLAKLRKYTSENVKMSVMLTDPIEAQLFRILLKILNAKKCIEVGTYTGYNALNMALSVPEDGVVYALDIDETYVNHGKPFFAEANVSKKIDIRIGPGAEGLDRLVEEGHGGTIDFIFIDADKVNYDTYYEKSLLLLRQGGIIALDNTFQGGKVLDVDAQPSDLKPMTQAIDNLNRKLKNDQRVMLSLLKIADGVTLCLKL